MTNLIPQAGGYSLVSNFPTLHRRIMFRHDPVPGGLPSIVIKLRGHDPIGCDQIARMAGGGSCQ